MISKLEVGFSKRIKPLFYKQFNNSFIPLEHFECAESDLTVMQTTEHVTAAVESAVTMYCLILSIS